MASYITAKPQSLKIENIPAFCITLDRRPDRWKRFQDQPGIKGLDITRFKAVDGKTIDITNDDRIALSTKRNILRKYRRSHEELDSVGGVGCALSHIAVWQWMVDNNQETVLIFEDDAQVPDDFMKRANECIKKSPLLQDPKKWDMWLLGGKWADLSYIPGEYHTIRVGAFYLFHAYVMTLHGAKQLLKEVYPIHCHIDLWVSIYANIHNFRMVGCKELIIPQCNRVKTDIQSDKGCDICDVPNDYEKSHMLVSKKEWKVAKMAEYMCLGLIGYVAYMQLFAKRG